jgi:hypothetical protein
MDKIKQNLVGILITIEWLDKGKRKHIVLHVRKRDRSGHYRAKMVHNKGDEE